MGACILIAVVFSYNTFVKKSNVKGTQTVQGVMAEVQKSYEFPGLTNQAKATENKLKMKIATAEKTSQVIVKDQIFTAKNNKMFLILNLELKNDITTPLNIAPGDLIRLEYIGETENKYAPDLHNNLVLVSAISTRNDRIGFVIPSEKKDFILYVGELEGNKEPVEIHFPS